MIRRRHEHVAPFSTYVDAGADQSHAVTESADGLEMEMVSATASQDLGRDRQASVLHLEARHRLDATLAGVDVEHGGGDARAHRQVRAGKALKPSLASGGQNVPGTCPRAARSALFHPPPGNETKKNPPVTLQLTEGF